MLRYELSFGSKLLKVDEAKQIVHLGRHQNPSRNGNTIPRQTFQLQRIQKTA